MTRRLTLTARARTDLAQVRLWYAQIRPDLATAFLDDIDRVFNAIRERPSSFAEVEPRSNPPSAAPCAITSRTRCTFGSATTMKCACSRCITSAAIPATGRIEKALGAGRESTHCNRRSAALLFAMMVVAAKWRADRKSRAGGPVKVIPSQDEGREKLISVVLPLREPRKVKSGVCAARAGRD